MHLVKVITVGIISFIFGFGLWACGISGNTQEWEKLPTPPQNVSELIPTGDPPFFIKTSDSKTYRYSDWHNEGWLQASIPQNPVNPFDVTKPCDFSLPEFSPFSNAPKSIKDCFQETTKYADGYIKYALVIDNDGNIWE